MLFCRRPHCASSCAAAACPAPRGLKQQAEIHSEGLMELLDSDGDCIQFLIDPRGRLREYVNGKLELDQVTWLEYNQETATVRDEKGEFKLQDKDQVEKALGLHCLALRSGIEWRGQLPRPAMRLELVDTDGDRLEFVVNEDKLQEFNNGELELQSISSLCFKFADGTVADDSGVFTLPPRECMQKVAALYSLALQAGIPWTGDNPQQMSAQPLGAEPKVLDIENCAQDWEVLCPKLWENLKPTLDPKQRFCETCFSHTGREIVHFCESAAELEAHTEQRRCVAFFAREDAAPAAPEGALALRVALLSGEELPELKVALESTGFDVKKAIATSAGYGPEEQRLLFNGEEVPDSQRLQERGIVDKAFLQLLRVPKPAEEPRLPRPGRKMGKRVAPRGR
ncbi:unnamed protein product [Effrenium voratum]|nr:unnamed protein product [Effrenium voratum]